MTIYYRTLTNEKFMEKWKNTAVLLMEECFGDFSIDSNISHIWFVAISDDELIGFTTLDTENTIWNVCVTEKFRKRKIGSKLVIMAIEKADYFNKPGPLLYTDTRKNVSFYESLGFILETVDTRYNPKLVSSGYKMYYSPVLRSIKRFTKLPRYHRWRLLPLKIKTQLVKFAKVALQYRRGNRKIQEKIISYSKIPTGNIFKVFDKKVAESEGVFKNELYFPNNGSKATVYNKKYDDIIMKWWSTEVIEDIHRRHIDMEPFINLSKEKKDEEIKKLKDYILRCATELLYDKIRSQYNFIDLGRLKCMSITCVILAAKFILQYDSIYERGILDYASKVVSRSDCSLEDIKKMEIDLLTTTNHQGCNEVRRRLNDAINPGSFVHDSYKIQLPLDNRREEELEKLFK